MSEERRLTSVRLTVRQLLWLKEESVKQRCPQQDVIEAALVGAGAPHAGWPHDFTRRVMRGEEYGYGCARCDEWVSTDDLQERAALWFESPCLVPVGAS